MPTASSLPIALALALATDPGLSPGAGAPPIPNTPAISAPSPMETPQTPVDVGDVAPDFSYQSFDGVWRRLQDLRAHGAVLLVLAPDAAELGALQTERERLLDLGVVPVAVCDVSARAAAALVRRLQLGYSVLADPQRVIAGQFGAVDPHSGAATAAWFVVDAKGRVRAVGRDGFPAGGYAPLASRALGVPLEGEARPAGSH